MLRISGMWRWVLMTTFSTWQWGVAADGQVPPAAPEFCVMDAMQATCPPDSVVIMRSALYGRMRIGRCVRTDFGFVGCYQDVLALADGRCSGQKSCTISVPDSLFENTQPCNEEFKSYLEADYGCHTVVMPDVETCEGAAYIRASGYHGSLASSVTAETGCGGELAPWVIEAKPGQTVNLTLWDFASGLPSTSSHSCSLYGYIKEVGSSTRHAVCAGAERSRHVFTSRGHSILVYISESYARSAAPAFLLDYSVEGCADPDAPEHGWVRREGDRAFVGCDGSDDELGLVCQGNSWEGERAVCTLGPQSQWEPAATRLFSMSTGLAITVVLGIAILVSGAIFFVGILIIRSRRQQSDTKYRHQYPAPASTTSTKTSTLKKAAETGYGYAGQGGDNDYSYVWGRDCMADGPYTDGRSVYETTRPQDPRRAPDGATGHMHGPQYFELDPNGPPSGGTGPTYEPVIFSHDYPPGHVSNTRPGGTLARVHVPVITPTSNSDSSNGALDIEGLHHTGSSRTHAL